MNSSGIFISGAGLVGSAMAIALGRAGLGARVYDAAPRAQAFAAEKDRRAIALAQSSVRIFRHLGVWDALAPHAEPILDIRAVDGHSTACVHYDHRDVGNEPFGYIVPGGILKTTLLQQAEATPGVTLAFETSVAGLAADGGGIDVTLSNGAQARGAVLLVADGRFSKTRALAGIGERVFTYGQTAIVCVIKHEKSHEGLALERFLPAGPFAALPMQGNRSGIVWTEPEAMTKHLLALEEKDFIRELSERLGEYLGEVTLDSPRFSYPLSLVMAKTYTAPRVALIGDAAHAIHPIAGQGVNLGYRDVAALADILTEASRLGLDPGSATLLEKYARRRRLDSLSMIAATDGLNRLFSNDIGPLRMLRRLGLSLVERAAPAKRYFMLHAMGLTGELPEMLKDKVA